MQESSLIPNQETDWDRIRPQLDTVLDELDERDRDAVLLRFFQNRPFAQIGETLRISGDAARMRVDRALEKLRALLARRGITSTTAALTLALENQTAAAVPVGLAATVNNALLASGAMGGAGSATVSSTFHSMSATTLTAGITSLVSILAVGTAIYQSNHARRAEASLVIASKASAERLNDLQARLATTEKSRPVLGRLGDRLYDRSRRASRGGARRQVPGLRLQADRSRRPQRKRRRSKRKPHRRYRSASR